MYVVILALFLTIFSDSVRSLPPGPPVSWTDRKFIEQVVKVIWTSTKVITSRNATVIITNTQFKEDRNYEKLRLMKF